MASGPGNLLDAAAVVWRLPDVAADRCVYSHLETASCRRCLSACPRDAWVLDDDMLGIDTEACDGCALCVPACPQGAVLSEAAPEIRRTREGDDTVFASCEQALTSDVAGRMPCVHAIGLHVLVRLYRRGVKAICVSRGDCGSCARGSAETLDARLAAFNRLLRGRALAPVRLVSVSVDQWEALRRTSADATCPATTRRAFLSAAIGRTVDRVVHRVLPQAVRGPKAEELTSPGLVLPRTGGHQPAFYAPAIDPLCCNGCDACVRLCPNGALAIADGGDAYRIDADACTGCGICVDACDRGAASFEAWAVPPANALELTRRRCAGCGAEFHWPAARGTPGVLCRICEATGSHRKLFQVMD